MSKQNQRLARALERLARKGGSHLDFYRFLKEKRPAWKSKWLGWLFLGWLLGLGTALLLLSALLGQASLG